MTPIDFRSPDFSITPSMRAHAERSLAASLGRTSQKLSRVTLSLRDENGPRGGVDKRLIVTARRPGRRAVVVTLRGGDAYALIADAWERVSRALSERTPRGRASRAVAPEAA